MKREANEVVLMIPGAECQGRRSSPKPNTEPIELENPPSISHISNLTSPCAEQLTQSTPAPSKLPNVPTKKSISQSLSAKLKSRSMEPSPPSASAEEEDDREVCNTAHPESGAMLGEKKFVLAQWVAFACIMGLLIASLTISKLQNRVIWEVRLWRWCLLMLAIFCGRLVTHWLINSLVFLIEKDYLLKRKVLYFLFALKDSAELFAWPCLVLLAWVWLIHHGVKRSPHTNRILHWVTRVLLFCLIGPALWLIKTFLIKWLAASFQCKGFFDRIQEYIFHHHVIRTLSDPRLAERADKSGRTRFSIRGVARKLEVVNVEKLMKMKPDKVTTWMMNGLIDIVGFSELSTLTGSLDIIDDDKAEQQDKDITDEKEAKKAASAIFKNVAKSESEFIKDEDLLRFMKEDYVKKFISLFPEAAKTRKIKWSSLESWLVTVYHERKSLICALKDVKTTTEELNKLVSAVLLVVVIIVGLLLAGLMKTEMLIFVLSQLLVFVYMFGDSIVFVFVMHPFDVSDRCVVEGVEMEVEEMNILATVFLTNDGQKLFYPNSILASKPISNLNRSSNMMACVEFMVDFSTSVESLEALKERIKTYMDSKPNIWNPGHRVVIKEIVDGDHLKMALHFSHRMNFQNAAERTEQRSNLVLELKKILEELRLQRRMLPQ